MESWAVPVQGVDTEAVCFSVELTGKPPSTHFPEGLHKMSYTVYDRAGNKASCRFSVRVRGDVRPIIHSINLSLVHLIFHLFIHLFIWKGLLF